MPHAHPHPQIGIQPFCADRLTVSRRRIQRLIEKADARADEEAVLRWAAYAAGVADVLTYLLDADQLAPLLAEILEV